MKFMLFLVAFYFLMMNSFCEGLTSSDLVEKNEENYIYRACPLNEDKPSCLKAAPVFIDKCKDEFEDFLKTNRTVERDLACIKMKVNGLYQYKMGAIVYIQIAEGDHCSGVCSNCILMEVELLNGDVVTKIPSCELHKSSVCIEEKNI